MAEEVLKDAMWDEHKVPMWINMINEKLMFQLMSLNKPYKYVVTVVMQQKTGAQISGAVACFYENTTDGVSAQTYPPQSRAKDVGQKTLQSLITVFATRFWGMDTHPRVVRLCLLFNPNRIDFDS